MVTGQEIKAARKRLGVSQAKLANLVGVSERAVGAWERGENAPGISESKLLEVLGVDRDALQIGEPGLVAASDAQLLAEIARRFSRTTGKAGTGHGNSLDEKSDRVREGLTMNESEAAPLTTPLETPTPD